MLKRLLIFIILLFAVNVHAFDVEYRTGKAFYKSGDIKAGTTHELRLGHNEIFLFGSTEDLQMYGQWIDVLGFGAGIRKDIEPFSFWLKAGYYDPKIEESLSWEAGYYHQNKVWGYIHKPTRWSRYTWELDSSIGAEIGTDFDYEILKNVILGLSLSYRYLHLYERTNGWSGDTLAWITEEDKDFGGFRTAIFINYNF